MKLNASILFSIVVLAFNFIPNRVTAQDYTDAEKKFFSDGHPVIDNVYGGKTCLTCSGPPSAECYRKYGGDSLPQSQFRSPTVKQSQGQVIGNLLLDSLNRMQDYEREKEERRDRIRQEQEQARQRRELMAIQDEQVRQPPASRQPTSNPANPSQVAVPANSAPAVTQTSPPVYTPPYSPPSLGSFLGDTAKETGAILGSELLDQIVAGRNLSVRDAARDGAKGFVADAFNGIVDDVKNSLVNSLPSDDQQTIRATRMPLSYLTFSWAEVKDAYFGPESTWQRDVVEPINTLTEGLLPK